MKMQNRVFHIAFLLCLISGAIAVEAKILIGDKIIIDKPGYEEIFTVGDEIHITAALQNEFIGIGRKITAVTEVDKDFIGLGIKLNFSGEAKRDLYLIGNTIGVNGKNAGSITAFGKNIHLKTSAGGNLRASAENIEVEAEINGKTTLWGKDISIGGQFQDIVVHGTDITFIKNTAINGNLTYNMPYKLDLSHIDIKGEVIWNKPFTEKIKETTLLVKIKKLYKFFSLLFPVLIMLWFFPNLFKQTTYISGRMFLKCFASGLVLIICILIALPVIFITIVGAPLGLIATSLFLSLIYISRVFPAIFAGRAIFFKLKDSTPIWLLSTFIGIFIFTAVSLHPTAKILLNIISIPAGFGALFLGRVNLIKKLRKEKLL